MHRVTPGCFKLNLQTLRRKATQTWGLRPADPTSSLSRSGKEHGLLQKLAALWSMTKVLDRGGVRSISQRLSGKLKEGSERSQTSPWHEQTEVRLYLASHILRTFCCLLDWQVRLLESALWWQVFIFLSDAIWPLQQHITDHCWGSQL